MSIIWGQPKISSCCLCVWCKLKEFGGRGNARFPTSMVESFSADFLAATEIYWTESHLEFYQTSTTELLCENMWIALDDWANDGYFDGLLHLW